jgi:hypothetical protein
VICGGADAVADLLLIDLPGRRVGPAGFAVEGMRSRSQAKIRRMIPVFAVVPGDGVVAFGKIRYFIMLITVFFQKRRRFPEKIRFLAFRGKGKLFRRQTGASRAATEASGDVTCVARKNKTAGIWKRRKNRVLFLKTYLTFIMVYYISE